MSYEYSEDALIEQATQDVLEELGWTVITAWLNESFGENSLLGRESKNEVILTRYLLQPLRTLNPDHPDTAYEPTVVLLTQNIADQTLGFINKEKSLLLKNGVPVSYTNDKGELIKTKLKVFNFNDYTVNHFLAARQLEIVGELYQRLPDIIGFVNGIPFVFMELKAHHQN